jgi:D-alanyl-D-alanine carboxypeptidase
MTFSAFFYFLRKRRRSVVALLLGLLVTLGFSSCETVAPQITGLPDNLTQAPGSNAFVIVDNDTGYILDQRQANARLPIAGLAHMATAMVAIDWMETSRVSTATQVPINPRSISMNLPNPLNLRAGDSMSLRDYLYAVLMNSDATAANALAHYVGGRMAQQIYRGNPAAAQSPHQVFVDQMNALAAQHGMARTRFTNPHGYDAAAADKPNTSTAADLARLTRYAISKPAFQFKVSQPTRQISVSRGGVQAENYTLRNTNQLLGQAGIDGVKTGSSQVAGASLVLSAERPPKTWQQGEQIYRINRRLVVVLLASPQRFPQGLSLVNYGWQLQETWLNQNRPTEANRLLDPPAPTTGRRGL